MRVEAKTEQLFQKMLAEINTKVSPIIDIEKLM